MLGATPKLNALRGRYSSSTSIRPPKDRACLTGSGRPFKEPATDDEDRVCAASASKVRRGLVVRVAPQSGNPGRMSSADCPPRTS